MPNCVGIRREDINPWEKRAPLIPAHVRELRESAGLEFRVQSSSIRVFGDADYLREGARITDDLSPCQVVFALKEIPPELLEPGKTYVFFSHTIKGQPHNMPMLRALMDRGCSLIDYERVTDDQGRRLLFFGRQAGHAGMIDTLWSLGYRLLVEGVKTPFSLIRQTHTFRSLVEARELVCHVGGHIERDGLPEAIVPCVFGFLGYGHVSQGAQEIFDLLPHEDIAPRDLAAFVRAGRFSRNKVYKVVFKEEDMVRPVRPGAAFDLQDYYRHPENYAPVLEDLVPYLTVLVNGIYWTPRYPRFVTKPFLRRLYGGPQSPRLRVVGDITCDIDGSMECTVKATDPKNPVYIYDPMEDEPLIGFQGRGPAVLAVYNLPAELPLESSVFFSGALKEFVPAIAGADYGRGAVEETGLPLPVRRALIVLRGKLTPDFEYLDAAVRAHGAAAAEGHR